MATFSMCTRAVRLFARTSMNVTLRKQGQSSTAFRAFTKDTETTEGNNEKSAKEGNANGEEQTPSPEATREALVASEAKFSELKTEHENLQKKQEDLQDKYKRALAETENVRQRMKKQIDETKLFGIQGFCKDLLEVADILNQATDSVPKEELKDSNPHLKNLFNGLTMTETQLQKVFTRNGLNQINPEEGEKFDPHVHEALFQQPVTDNQTGGTVSVVTKIGYKLHDRTIRPALVGVYKS